LVDTCCQSTLELQFRREGQLVAVSIVDCGAQSLSAVYTYFDPAFDRLSLGTYSILKQMQLAESTQRKYVYLGMYVAQNQHLNYKARFRPQERLIGGRWIAFD
jgi:arginyl-tRNA--protein-N-Asp/Glu arginylyltransferase